MSVEQDPVVLKKKINFSVLFPKEPGINYSKLLITDIGLYSITKPSQTEEIIELISRHTNQKLNDLVLTESNGGMGGDTIAFSKVFKHVNTVEYSDIHCDILINNVKNVYHRKNVTFYCADYTTIFHNLKQDVLYMDPPWGGPAYKYVEQLPLYIGNHSIEEIILEIDPSTKLVVIKAPLNYNLQQLKDIVPYKKIDIYKVSSYQIIVLEFDI